MGFYNIWKKSSPVTNLPIVASKVLERSLGEWHHGHSRWHPYVAVQMISSISKIKPLAPGRWWTRWAHRLGLL